MSIVYAFAWGSVLSALAYIAIDALIVSVKPQVHRFRELVK